MNELEPDAEVAIGDCIAVDYHPEDTAVRGFEGEYAFFAEYGEERRVLNVPTDAVDPDAFAGERVAVSDLPEGSYEAWHRE